jgi:hypothetical protein
MNVEWTEGTKALAPAEIPYLLLGFFVSLFSIVETLVEDDLARPSLT